MNPDFKWTTRVEKLEVVRYWWREQRGMCWICNDRDNPMEPYSQAAISPWAATVEHLIPKRENGPDTVGNVRLAHRWCNNVLGALWQINQDRAKAGLSPMTQKWALNTAYGNLYPQFKDNRERMAAEAPARAARGVEWRKKNALVRALETGAGLPLPRGATLPPEPTEVAVFAHSAYKAPVKISGVELAQLLRKANGNWPLA